MKLLIKGAMLVGALAFAGTANAAVQWTTGPGANKHWYAIGSSPTSFGQALKNAAVATPIAGYQSYLVTVTSVDEANFLLSNFGNFGQAWAAGSDQAVEGTWTWLAGPEAGQTFWKDGITLTYAAWNGGTSEPNNAGDEDGLLLHQFGGITWNDANVASGYNYIVEYSKVVGDVPEPATWAMMTLGLGLVGFAMRKRSNVRTSVSYA